MIVIVDYGMGNLGSIVNMLKRLGVRDSVISSRIEDITCADKLILPGVGAFDTAMQNLHRGGFLEVLHDKVIQQKTLCLGICLGMQLFFKKSAEGALPGLGWINGEVVKFQFRPQSHLKIPHMGWNITHQKKKSPLCDAMFSENRFYFVHSYHAVCSDPEEVLLTAHYGYEFVAAVERDNIFGVQFHPEKSHRFGMKLLENFTKI